MVNGWTRTTTAGGTSRDTGKTVAGMSTTIIIGTTIETGETTVETRVTTTITASASCRHAP